MQLNLKRLLHIFILIFVIACNDDNNEIIPEPDKPIKTDTEQTVFLYMPWSTNLTSFFKNNIKNIEQALGQNIMQNDRFLIFFAHEINEAVLFELSYENGTVKSDTIRYYDEVTFITSGGITNLINEIKDIAPAKRYSMIISSHGMAWLPKSETKSEYYQEYWEHESPFLTKTYDNNYLESNITRYFGGGTPEYQIDIYEFAEGVRNSNTKFEYILFDNCYMSSIEVIYEIKDITNYIIASPTEIMAYGYPYGIIGKYLFGTPNYKGISEGFVDFYKTYSMPCGTIGVTVCSEVEEMANVMKEINSAHEFEDSKREKIQRLDGYTPILFYDFGDYVKNLCGDDEYLLGKFYNQLDKMIPQEYRLSTDSYFCQGLGRVNIKSYSGINTSEPSNNKRVVDIIETSWYKATH